MLQAIWLVKQLIIIFLWLSFCNRCSFTISYAFNILTCWIVCTVTLLVLSRPQATRSSSVVRIGLRWIQSFKHVSRLPMKWLCDHWRQTSAVAAAAATSRLCVHQVWLGHGSVTVTHGWPPAARCYTVRAVRACWQTTLSWLPPLRDSTLQCEWKPTLLLCFSSQFAAKFGVLQTIGLLHCLLLLQ